MKNQGVSSKQIEMLVGKNITLTFTVSGNCQAQFFGKIVGRVRNRFKQYLFIPAAPFTSICFSTGDVEKIEMPDEDTWLLTIYSNSPEPKKRHRKKKKNLPVVSAEPTVAIDLNNLPAVDEPFMASDI